MSQEIQLHELAERDEQCCQHERETVIRWSAGDDRADVMSAERAVMRRLLAHPHCTIESVTVADGENRPSRTLDEVEGDDEIVAVRGELPIGAISVKSEPRSTDQHALTVSGRVLDEVSE